MESKYYIGNTPPTGNVPASDITFSPAGGVQATDVQAAIQEVDSEKLNITGKAANSSLLNGKSDTAFALASHTHSASQVGLTNLSNNGNNVTGNFTATGNVTAYSDERVKANIQKIDNALDKVNQLNGYTFDRTDVDMPRQTGVIAQEIQKVLPEAVVESEDGQSTVAYGNLVGLLIEAVNELTNKVKALENK